MKTNSIPAIGGIRLALDQPRGAWVTMLVVACVAVLSIATSIPFRRVELHDVATASGAAS